MRSRKPGETCRPHDRDSSISPDRLVDRPAARELADTDRPILAAAIQSGATHLLTGDKTYFGPLFGQLIGSVPVLTPGEYLHLTRD